MSLNHVSAIRGEVHYYLKLKKALADRCSPSRRFAPSQVDPDRQDERHEYGALKGQRTANVEQVGATQTFENACDRSQESKVNDDESAIDEVGGNTTDGCRQVGWGHR